MSQSLLLFLSFFFLLMPPPPRSTLFPYTTLFRSPTVTKARGRNIPARDSNVTCNFAPKTISACVIQRRKVEIGRARLNSSHTVISYAVFCLKKKKTSVNKDNPRRKHTDDKAVLSQ